MKKSLFKRIIRFLYLAKFITLPIDIKNMILRFHKYQLIQRSLIIYHYLYLLQKKRDFFFLRYARKLLFQQFKNTQKVFVNVLLFVNFKIVKKKLEKLGIIMNSKPYFLKKLINFSDIYIITYYNNIISDFYLYYQQVINFKSLQKLLRYFIS
jgi:hypothetical protein